ncbi:MAG: cyclic nucleotide-binding domain-containing protein [Nitratireductor sp.]
MSLDTYIQHLQNVPLFDGFTQEQLRLIVFGAEPRKVRAGKTLFQQDDLLLGGYIVLSGQIDFVQYSGSEENLVETYGTGQLIGELALVSAYKGAANAVGVVETELLFISRDLFLKLLGEYPELANLLLERIQYNVDKTINKLSHIQSKLDRIPNLS